MKRNLFKNYRTLIFLAVLLSGALQIQAGQGHQLAEPGESFADFTTDGGWCWFSNPRAVVHNGKTFTGWVTEDGSVQVGCFDPATGVITQFTLHPQYERDDHDNPALLFLPDGRLRAFYTKHNRADEINTRVTKRADDISDWEPEETIVPKDASPKRSNITYANPFMLSEEGNAIYLFFRGHTYKPTMAKSTDWGKTWLEARPVFVGSGGMARPYAQYASNDKDRIHLLFTDGHPRNEKWNSVYYACYRDGAFYKADGTRICGVDQLPFGPDKADLIYDATKTGARAWIWDIAFDAQDRPVVVYTRLPSETDHRYHYARWTGKEWFDTELCAGGKWFPQTPPGKKESEPHYSSGLALDPENPSVVYLTRPVNEVRELEKWTTSDEGKTWKSEAITQKSLKDNIRPVVLKNPAPNGPTVLWQNLSGYYEHFTRYHCSIKMNLPGKGQVSPMAKPAVIQPAAQSTPTKPTATQPAENKTAAAKPAEINPAEVLKVMERVGDWQLVNPSRHRPDDWTQAAGYTGIIALANISENPRYRAAMVAMGEKNQWKLGPRKFHADDHAVGQTYAELYLQYRDPKMIEPMQQQFDEAVEHLREPQDLHFQGEGKGGLWTWADALFMAPPALMRLYTATGDTRYRDCAVENWWRTSDYLYDTQAHLFFRDSSYFNKREANGAKVFWGRGNGWVMGGLVRMLQYLPANDPARPRFEKQFKDMAAAVLKCQQADGLWRASLLDPNSFPLKETSGSGFFTYALAYGVNQGLLERSVYEPAIRKAWIALVACVNPDGKLTHVQPIGADPRQFDEGATEIYGVGAFLLAGSEVYQMIRAQNLINFF